MGIETGSNLKSSATGSGAEKKLQTVCGICPMGCGVEVVVRDGVLDEVRPLKGHPRGILCTRGAASKEVVYSPDRLKYPLKRVGARGEGKFERTSWDDALNLVAEKMLRIKEEYGPQAMVEYSGRGGGFEQSLYDMFAVKGAPQLPIKNFLFPFGSPNATGCSSICYISYGRIAPMTTIGTDMRFTQPDFEKSAMIVVWGANPATQSPPNEMKRILDAKRRGARVVAIDHMMSILAQKADEWVPVRPGTDGALALSLMNVIIEEGLYDKRFVEKWTAGFEELRDYARAFAPESAEKITWVPATTIKRLAREIAGAKGASLYTYTGLEYSNSGVQSIRAVLALWAITGNLDVPGGIVFRGGSRLRMSKINLDPPQGPPAIGAKEYPLFYKYTRSAQFMEFPKAVLKGEPYKIRGLLINGASILTSYPEPGLWAEAFEALDLLAVVDRFMTRDAMFADLVLPATTYYEIESYQRFLNYVQLRQKAIEPLGESRSDYAILSDLARRLGYGQIYPASEREVMEHVFKDCEIPLEELRRNPSGMGLPEKLAYRKYEKGLLRRDGKPGFETPSGKVEIISSALEKYGYPGLPVYTEPAEGPVASAELARDFPLVFNSGARIQSTFRSQHLNIKRLVKMQPEPMVIMHEDDARTRDIADGEGVLVVTPRGQVPFRAKVTGGIMRGVVEANMGGGGPLGPKEWREANVNELTDFHNRDPISGFPVLKALLCDVKKAARRGGG